MSLYIRLTCAFLVAIILLSSCGAGSHSSLAFSKRKYTKGHFTDHVAKVKLPAPIITISKREINASVSAPGAIAASMSTNTAPGRLGTSKTSTRTTSLISLFKNSAPLNKIFPCNITARSQVNGDGIPGHGNNNSEQKTTNYGGKGLLLTLLSFPAFLIGIIFAAAGSSFWSGGNGNPGEVAIGVILLIASPILFIVGLVFNILGSNKKDKHEGSAIAGLVIDILFVIVVLALAL